MSVGEAEFYAAVSGVVESLFVRNLLQFFGVFAHIELASDSSTARAIMSREGIGKLRHMETRCLWTQRLVKSGEVVLAVIKGKENSSDLGTKVLPGPTIEKHCNDIHFVSFAALRSEVPEKGAALVRKLLESFNLGSMLLADLELE